MNDLQKATSAAIVNIFETGRVRGDYGAIAVLKGDSGHLSYGRSKRTSLLIPTKMFAHCCSRRAEKIP